ncbi:HAD family hydrolase [Halolactibacillus sp. JCM 19043]|uniref:HAD family hydrolase n=1 Tax=Halolactibacillus sp. JCM 19043 TaxID=1460638 RepID=UPI00078170E0|nr:HAD hydrolase family protein [Halolactibacillus sp. JCM 19043]
MAEQIKLVALDLDGTLVEHGGKVVTPRLIEAVKEAKKQEVDVVIATGRHRTTSLSIAETLESII